MICIDNAVCYIQMQQWKFVDVFILYSTKPSKPSEHAVKQLSDSILWSHYTSTILISLVIEHAED